MNKSIDLSFQFHQSSIRIHDMFDWCQHFWIWIQVLNHEMENLQTKQYAKIHLFMRTF